MMKIKRLFIFCFTFAALVGILNCTVIEPAFAYDNHCESACQEETNCSSCHFLHHQWAGFQKSTDISGLLQVTFLSSELNNLIPESPQGSIFHPPILI